MKKLISLFLCLTMLFCTSCLNGAPNAESLDTGEPPEPPEGSVTEAVTDAPTEEVTETPAPEEGLVYQAHRGLSTDYPENTVLAIEKAIEAGFKIVEIDPSFTADGRCVLMHDTTLNRTCRRADGSSLPENTAVSSMTFEQIRALDAGLFKGKSFKGTQVPLLEEAIKAAQADGITVKIDNKIQKYSAAEQEIIFMLAERYPETVGITCKDVEFVIKVRDRLPNAIIHYDGGVNEKIAESLRKLVGENRLYIWYPVANATADICAGLKKHGILGLWTVKSEAELEKAIALGADVIETNGEVRP